MEVVEICHTKNVHNPIYRPPTCPSNVKCTRRYVQPSRVVSFAPQRKYCPPANPLDAKTTYHLSYLNTDRCPLAKPFRPVNSIDISDGKFADDTTTKLSYKPIWGIIKPNPIIPRRRPVSNNAPMQNVTTVRHDYIGQYIQRPDKIVPSGHIRTSSSPLDGRTTTHLSFMKPGPIEPVISFKPQRKYCPPKQPLPKETTHKLSFQPVRVSKREIYPWAQKPLYRPPESIMTSETTYSKCFMENGNVSREKPILPPKSNLFPLGAEFTGKTIYKDSFLYCQSEPIVPIIPPCNITLPDDRMQTDTTNKLSYQPVKCVKRDPIIPRRRKMIEDGPIESMTTAKHDFTPKFVSPPTMIVPSGNISFANQPLQDKTTFALSYINPAPVSQLQSFKPVLKYNKPIDKLEAETVNKLSYQQWQLQPKEHLPWTEKKRYEPPKEPMQGDTVCHMSYSAPGYYIEECEPSPALKQNDLSPRPSPLGPDKTQ